MNFALSPPPAPWRLTGAALVFPLRRGRRLGALGLVRYDSSPVGAYCELLEAFPTLLGPTVTRMLVTSQDSRQGGRTIWGYPKEIAPLVWHQEDNGCIAFRHNHQTWRARPVGPRLPFKARAWTVQNLDGQRVRVPCKVSGTLRLARCGRVWGALLHDFVLEIGPPQPV